MQTSSVPNQRKFYCDIALLHIPNIEVVTDSLTFVDAKEWGVKISDSVMEKMK